MDPQQQPQSQLYAPPPLQNPNPNFQPHQQYHYPNPNTNPEDAAAAVVSPLQNPNPNFQHHQQYYYTNPNTNSEDAAAAAVVSPLQNPNPNFQHHQQYYYQNPNTNPEAAATATAAAAVWHGPHGGSSVDPTESAGSNGAPYYYCQGYGWDPSQYYGVYPNSYGQAPPAPSNVPNSTVSPHAAPSQRVAKSNYNRGSKKGFIKMTKVAQPVQCSVCKIGCNTQEVLNLHKQGKKHKKNLQKLQESITPKSQRAQTTEGSKILGGVAAQRAHCEVCKIYCDTEAVLNIHKQGKKHTSNLRKSQSLTITPKPENAEESKMYCATCKIFCNSQEVLNIHNVGRKHTSNLSKLQNSTEEGKDLGLEGRKRREVDEEGLERKRRKILDGGAVASEVKVCGICNVVVNSLVVYNAHIKGSKHAAMVKSKTSVEAESVVDPIVAPDC